MINKIKYTTITIITFLITFFGPSFINLLLTYFKINKNYIPLISSIVTLIIILIIFKKVLIKDLKKINLNIIKTGLKYWILGLLLMYILNFIITILGGNISVNEELNREMLKNNLTYSIFLTCIFAPLTEELIFRKSIKDIIKNKYIFIFISGFIFGSLHMLTEINEYIVNNAFNINLLYIITYSTLGFAFASSYYKTKNIYSSIIPHFLHNLLAIITIIVL